jgi:CubicO group peptidase (beta-lactamase class C family)
MLQRLTACILVFLTILAGCTPEAPQAEVYPGKEWTWASSPESLGWSSEKLAVARAYSKRIGSAAVMIVDDGVVVDAWGDLEYKYHCHSMRKSLISALVGIYVADGKIDLTQTLGELGIDDVTPLTEVEKTATIADLLSARSGVYLKAAGEGGIMIPRRPQRGSHAPGTFWYYNNWDFNALGTIFDQLSGEESIYAAFAKRIAQTIGMEDYDLADPDLTYSYETYSMHPFYYFHMSARDLARFGLLFLRNGRWGEQQVISADWVRESTTSHSDIGPQSGYGYLWWTGEGVGLLPNVDEGPGAYAAYGASGHRLIIMPSRNLVVVHRSNTEVGGVDVPDWEVGTLLWLILDAAGEKNIGDSILLENSQGTVLTAETLPQVLLASPFNVIVNSKFTLTLDSDQTLSLFENDTLLVKGRWWMEGDHYCQDLGLGFGGKQCFQVLQNGNRIILFDLDGYAALQLEAASR